LRQALALATAGVILRPFNLAEAIWPVAVPRCWQYQL
jgi:hypothetical protein